MKVWVVVADYGLNGASCVGVFTKQPSVAQLVEMQQQPADPARPWLLHTGVTGFAGLEATECEVDDG